MNKTVWFLSSCGETSNKSIQLFWKRLWRKRLARALNLYMSICSRKWDDWSGKASLMNKAASRQRPSWWEVSISNRECTCLCVVCLCMCMRAWLEKFKPREAACWKTLKQRNAMEYLMTQKTNVTEVWWAIRKMAWSWKNRQGCDPTDQRNRRSSVCGRNNKYINLAKVRG